MRKNYSKGVSVTSKIAFHQNKANGMFKTLKQEFLYLFSVSERGLCGRDFEYITGVRTSTISGVLYELEMDGYIEIVERDKSPYSGKTVNFYKLIGEASIVYTTPLFPEYSPVGTDKIAA